MMVVSPVPDGTEPGEGAESCERAEPCDLAEERVADAVAELSATFDPVPDAVSEAARRAFADARRRRTVGERERERDS